MPVTIADTKNIDTFRRRINRELVDYAPGYGDALPDVEDVPDGKIFYAAGVGYQSRNGAWEAL